MASIELDPPIKLALRYLHSSARDSTEQVRLIFDDLLTHNYGPSKTMANVLPKKYLQEERNVDSGSYQKPRHKGESSSKSGSSKNVSCSSPPAPPQLQIAERDGEDVMESFNLLEEDLTCAVCRQFAVQAGNRLVECDACHDLYHQDCHKPPISESDMESGWQCANCLITTHGFNMGNVSSAKSSSTPIKNSPGKQSSSSSSSVKISNSSSSSSTSCSSSSKLVTPNINIISADKRLQIMKKKAAKQHEIKRKHSK